MSIEKRLLGHLPIHHLPGIGPNIEKKFHQLNLFTIKDLLLHFPFRYEDRTLTKPINQLEIGLTTTVVGEIIKSEVTSGRRRMLIVTLNDGFGIIKLRFIHFNQGMQYSFKVGSWVKAYGEVKRSQYSYEMIHPQIQIKAQQSDLEQIESERFTPIYSSTYGVTQQTIRKFIDIALKLVKNNPYKELLPANLASLYPSIEQCVEILHHPPLDINIEYLINGEHPAKKRLIIEELLSQQLAMNFIKQDNLTHQAPSLTPSKEVMDQFLSSLPYQPTQAQKRVTVEILSDLKADKPMMRLVQGDVGSGKTLVAALSALAALDNHYQVVLMAPTEILAEQHYAQFQSWFNDFNINIALLTGKVTAKNKKIIYQNLAEHKIDLLIGTHAVFVDKVIFKKLGLVIIDEQHRFGVNQRLNLWEKGEESQLFPHQLTMTATPIPRTLAMTLYADLDISLIDELPPGRSPITTTVISNSRREEIIERVNVACSNDKQAYWICTLVEESEILEAQAAEVIFEELQARLPNLKIGLIHGKMKSKEKETIMQQFKNNEITLLIATTVIEVGVDVPNASLMIIENAERLGLAQLHQLRGRVGRGSVESFCILMYQAPLSLIAKERLNLMRQTQDGFLIAEKDFELRGGGEILGTRQIGIANFKVADLIRDQQLLPEIQNISRDMLQNYPHQIEEIIHFWISDKSRFIHA